MGHGVETVPDRAEHSAIGGKAGSWPAIKQGPIPTWVLGLARLKIAGTAPWVVGAVSRESSMFKP